MVRVGERSSLSEKVKWANGELADTGVIEAALAVPIIMLSANGVARRIFKVVPKCFMVIVYLLSGTLNCWLSIS